MIKVKWLNFAKAKNPQQKKRKSGLFLILIFFSYYTYYKGGDGRLLIEAEIWGTGGAKRVQKSRRGVDRESELFFYEIIACNLSCKDKKTLLVSHVK